MSTSSLPQRLPERDAFHVYDTTLRDGAQREGISYQSSTNWRWPGCSMTTALASSRADGPAPAQGHRVLRTSAKRTVADVCAVGRLRCNHKAGG